MSRWMDSGGGQWVRENGTDEGWCRQTHILIVHVRRPRLSLYEHVRVRQCVLARNTICNVRVRVRARPRPPPHDRRIFASSLASRIIDGNPG